MSQITLIRHCEIESQFHGHYNGHIDIALSPKGHQQAIALNQALIKENNLLLIDKIYCSDLIRCQQSIAPFIQQHPHLSVKYTKKLREKYWGRHEGMSYTQICQQEHVNFQNFSQWLEYLDGESVNNFRQRTIDYFKKINHKHQGRQIIVMTHAGNIRTLIAHSLKLTLEQAFSLNIPYGFHLQLKNLIPIENIPQLNHHK